MIECVFCGYVGSQRTYRDVGTPDHPLDKICNLCDTEVQGGTGREQE